MADLIISEAIIENKIYQIRGAKVMLDKDLATLYGVTTGNLNKAVNRNLKRFPDDFMFQLSKAEYENLIFQIGTSSWGGTRKMPNAFTEQGVAMLSSVLGSDRSIDVNIKIIRIFTKMRELLLTHQELLIKLQKIEKHIISHGHGLKQYDGEIKIIFELIDELRKDKSTQKQIKRVPIGFKIKK
jgi:hypothetical protein